MKITPLDIQHQQFSVRLRGFDVGEVDRFLELVADTFEEVHGENERLKEKVHRLRKEKEAIKSREDTFRKTLLEAQGVIEHMKENAEKKARTIIDQAQLKADQIVNRAHNRLGKLHGDIAELKRMEEEILKAEKLESLGVLAGGLAHDFNNVLTTILGNVSMAKYQASPESDIFELLSEVEAASKRAQSLTNQLLTFAKGGAPVKETASLADIIKESSGFVMSGSKSVCELSIADNLWPVEVDVGQISQVIHNIIINANQAMPEGGVIKIRAGNLIIDEGNERQLKPGRYVRMSFNDEGMGISEKHLSKIFDPYFTTKHAGSGLGLAATYSIIRRHGGIITVETQMEIGTTFHICLPASEKPVPDKERAELLTGKGKILVMDDEAPLRKMYGMVLGKLGYTSEFAEDGDEALRMAKEAKQASKPYDAAILDLTIPGGMGGKEAIQKLLEIDPEIRAIVSSGYADDPVMADFQEYGFKGRLAKPFEFGALSNVLHEVIKGE